MDITNQTAEVVSRKAWLALGISSLAAFMVALEVTVISLALPDIQDAFKGVPTTKASWVFSAYSIGVASLLLLGGWLADLLGRKRVFLAGMTVFALGSLGSGTAQSIDWLIFARAVQAVGGALLSPAALALVMTAFPISRRQMAIGVWGATGGLAGALGPSLGALLIESFGWRAVFLINVPIAALAIPIGMRVLSESRMENVNRRVDLIGVPLASLGVGALVLGIVQGRDWGWGSTRVVGSLVLAVVLIFVFVLRARRHPAPLFDLSLFSIRSYRIGIIGSLLFSSSFFGVWVLLPSFIERTWHWSVLKTGLALMPGPLISAVASGPIGSMVDRFGHRRVVAFGALNGTLAMVSLALFMRITPQLWLGVMLPNLFLGACMAVLFAMLIGASMRDIPPHRYGTAGAGRNTAFQLAQAIGVAVAVAVVGRPSTAAATLSNYRSSWLLAAVILAGLAVLFLVAYPARVSSPAAPADATLGTDPAPA